MNRMTFTTAIILSSALIVLPSTVAGSEVYRWVDEQGVVHFGDRAPEGTQATTINVKPNTVELVQPASHANPETGAEPPVDGATAPELSYAQQRRQDRTERRKLAAEEASTMEAQCAIMRRQKETVEPSTRVMVNDENGGVRRLDDNERMEALQQANDFLAKNCN